MTRISGPSRPAAAAPTAAARTNGVASGASFSLPASGVAASQDEVRAPSLSGVGPTDPLSVILTLQQAEATEPAERRNRRAKQHGQAMLDTLATLQRDLLAPQTPNAADATLGHLAQLLDAPQAGLEAAADPRLDGIVRAIACRAAVTIALRAAANAPANRAGNALPPADASQH
jgi:hypothetical protein